jgi:hypothetical protein
MQYILNERAVAVYAEKFSSKVCDAFFGGKEKITGPEIVELTPARQVNFFVIKELFQRWTQEAKSLESPYFDYNDSAVKNAMAALMNILSQNISIDRRRFEPLMVRAVIDTLTLLLSPEAYYGKFLSAFNYKVSYKKELKPIAKYIKAHRSLLDALAKEIDAKGKKVKSEWAMAYVCKLLENNDLLSDVQEELRAMNSVEAINLKVMVQGPKPLGKSVAWDDDDDDDEAVSPPLNETFAQEVKPAETSKPQTPQPAVGEHPETHEELFDTLHSHINQEASNLHLGLHDEDVKTLGHDSHKPDVPQSHDNKQAQEVKPVYQPPITPQPEPERHGPPQIREADEIITEREAPVAKAEPRAGKEADAYDPFRSFVKKDEPAPSAKPLIKADAQDDDEDDKSNIRPTLLDALSGNKKTGKKLKGSIPLNLRFKFQNDLFDGDGGELSRAVELIDECKSLHEAMALVKEKYVKKYNWDLNAEATKEFFNVLSKAYE